MTRGGRSSAGLGELKKVEQEEEGRSFYAGMNTFSCSCLKTSTWISWTFSRDPLFPSEILATHLKALCWGSLHGG